MKLVTRLLTRYWGYLAVVIAVAGFFLHSIGLAVVIALALAALGYFLFQAPLCQTLVRHEAAANL